MSHMLVRDEDGAQDVPDPICPTYMTLAWLAPTRTPMSFPEITNSDPVFVGPMPGIPSMPFIPLMSPGEGLAIGIGMSIFCPGEVCGFGEADGICMPGIFICVCGEAEGDACRICIPGMFICICGDADGEACGICIPGIFICFGEAEGGACGICMPGMFICICCGEG